MGQGVSQSRALENNVAAARQRGRQSEKAQRCKGEEVGVKWSRSVLENRKRFRQAGRHGWGWAGPAMWVLRPH